MASQTRIYYDHYAKVLEVRRRMLDGGVDIHVNYVSKNKPENLRVKVGTTPSEEEIERMNNIMLHSRHLFEAIVINGKKYIPCEERVQEYLKMMGMHNLKRNSRPLGTVVEAK